MTHRLGLGLPTSLRSSRTQPVQLAARLRQRGFQVALLLRRRQGALQLALRGRQVRHQLCLSYMSTQIRDAGPATMWSCAAHAATRDTNTKFLRPSSFPSIEPVKRSCNSMSKSTRPGRDMARDARACLVFHGVLLRRTQRLRIARVRCYTHMERHQLRRLSCVSNLGDLGRRVTCDLSSDVFASQSGSCSNA